MGKILFFSGAGISKPSGIQTFRDSDGAMWNNFNINQVCNINTWSKHRKIVYEFYNNRRRELQDVDPNVAHNLIARLQKQFGTSKVINITQNVDDLFERAGAKKTLHVHGTLLETICRKCGHIEHIGYSDMQYDNTCKSCGSVYIKPNVVFFHEKAPMYEEMDKIIASLTKDDMVVIIGTSGEVIPYGRMVNQTAPTKNIINVLDDPTGYLENQGYILFSEVHLKDAEQFMKEKYNEFEKFLKG